MGVPVAQAHTARQLTPKTLANSVHVNPLRILREFKEEAVVGGTIGAEWSLMRFDSAIQILNFRVFYRHGKYTVNSKYGQVLCQCQGTGHED